jgi:hypothetical protein
MESSMSSHVRALLFCISLLAAPGLFIVGERFGSAGGWLLPGAVVTAAAIYSQGGPRKPPTGAKPA